MQITSPNFASNGNLPSRYTCDDQDISPSLVWSDLPAKTQSLALIMEDPDAVKPAGKVWDHWIVFNILPNTKEVKEGQEPEGIHGLGTSNNLKYHGPCPPDGRHRYFFKLYALDTMLNLPEGSTKLQVEKAMEGHILEQAELIGLYQRKR